MKNKGAIFVICVMCVMGFISAIGLILTPGPRPYERLKGEMVPHESIAEIAEKEYADGLVALTLIANKTDKFVAHLSDEDIRSATLLGPFPIFSAAVQPERLLPFSIHQVKRWDVFAFNSADELVRSFRHAENRWGFIAMAQDQPICYFEIKEENGRFTSLGEIHDAHVANAAYLAYQRLERSSASEKFIVAWQLDKFFTDDKDTLSLFTNPEVYYPAVTYNDFLHAMNTMVSEKSYPLKEGRGDLEKYLFGEDGPPIVRQQNYFFLGLVIGGSVAILGAAAFIELQKRRKRAAPRP